jgi:predicted metalloprotease
MRWRGGRRSRNVEDRRGRRLSRGVKGGGLGIVVIALVAMFFGIDPSVVLDLGQPIDLQPAGYRTTQAPPTDSDELADFVAVVLADTEDTWHALFDQAGKSYREPTLVLFRDAVQSACGFARSAVGPFYCPADQKVYLDLAFFDDLHHRHQAPGDFAQAYVIAHEIGHHVQTLLGISAKVHSLKKNADPKTANQLSVRQELQADCLAGVWAHHADAARQILEAGDVAEALQAASQIGDDRLQREAKGYVVPDSFTHGSSDQRVRWFRRGLQSGAIGRCNTFQTADL